MNPVKAGFAGAEPVFANGRFGSQADLFPDITSAAVTGQLAVVRFRYCLTVLAWASTDYRS